MGKDHRQPSGFGICGSDTFRAIPLVLERIPQPVLPARPWPAGRRRWVEELRSWLVDLLISHSPPSSGYSARLGNDFAYTHDGTPNTVEAIGCFHRRDPESIREWITLNGLPGSLNRKPWRIQSFGFGAAWLAHARRRNERSIGR
jgi:hypothetical protein